MNILSLTNQPLHLLQEVTKKNRYVYLIENFQNTHFSFYFCSDFCSGIAYKLDAYLIRYGLICICIHKTLEYVLRKIWLNLSNQLGRFQDHIYMLKVEGVGWGWGAVMFFGTHDEKLLGSLFVHFSKNIFQTSLIWTKWTHTKLWQSSSDLKACRHKHTVMSVYFWPCSVNQNSLQDADHGLHNQSALITSHVCDYARVSPSKAP